MGRTLKRCSLLLFILPVLYGQGVTGNGGGGSSSSSSPGSPGVPQCVQTNSVTVTGVTAETSLVGTCAGTGTATLPANFFSAAGSILRIYGQYHYSGTVNATVWKLKLGGTQIVAAALTPAAITYSCILNLVLTARTVGSSGTIMGNGVINCDGTAAQGNTDIVFNILASPVVINTTTTELFDFTVTPGAIGQSHTVDGLVLASY